MASVSYTEDLTCSICLAIFTDPVMLLCGHSFCRECITDALSTQPQCPHCRLAVPKEGNYLPTNHILKNLAEKEAAKLRSEPGNNKEVVELCLEHEEKLKLFCVTDQQLACIICRDGEKHEGHKFKPIKEAAASLRKELEAGMESLCGDTLAVESQANVQREEIKKTKEKSKQLKTQICRQFEEMHQFLREREDEIKKDLKHKEEDAVNKMTETLNAMETALSERRELEGKLTSVLDMNDSEMFLKCWTENNSEMTPEQLFRSRADELQVVCASFSLGPYESHLQFFIWKEMLQVIQPRAEQLSLKSDSGNITVSEDGRNLMYSPKIIQSPQYSLQYRQAGFRQTWETCHVPSYIEEVSERCAVAFSTNEFSSGQHYWEIDAGKRNYWKVGVKNYHLSYNQKKYETSSKKKLTFTGRPQKIGIYLDCQSKELSFYDADNMIHIHTECHISLPTTAHFEYKFSKAADHYPLRVCWKKKNAKSLRLKNRKTSDMASALYSEDLTCSVCLTIFTDPVTLLCGHSFCRQCITDVLSTQKQCPQCQTHVPREGTCLPTSHILKSLAEKAKEAEQKKTEHGREKAEVVELCLEHEEKLKLFCVTDQQLACIICRDGEKHEGHKFKPIKEAAASLKKELEAGMESLCGDTLALESQANAQREEIKKTKEKSKQLMAQICRQFEEMHQFLRKREDEIKKDLKHKEEDAVNKMTETLNAMETALSERRELEGKLTSVLDMNDSEMFLKCWTENNSEMSPEQLFRSRADELQVVNTSLSLGPYESHLQFFIWKEMLQVIQPREEQLSLRRNNTGITVSDDGRSLFCTPNSRNSQATASLFGSSGSFGQKNTFTFGTGLYTTYTNPAFSVSEFSSGQHYWEIDVGHRDYWELGINDYFLKYDGQKYSTCIPDITTELSYENRPRKIGIYLNCSSKRISFYDADNMARIRTMCCELMSIPLSAYFNIRYREPDPNPMTMCWY
ncbi:nuclear factor 7, ovary-like [Toxotes jaculatrix]|uniref:nuclear factor 7, ovary-like n=1 Tax=Toxotes jaculatrix TaxID=941984 RepID=UPI001B3AFA2C|nr:nuclear factor 7, ovary-like [Toxotes jaculatrix]